MVTFEPRIQEMAVTGQPVQLANTSLASIIRSLNNSSNSDIANITGFNVIANRTSPVVVLADGWQLLFGSTVFATVLPLLYFVLSFLPLGPMAALLFGASQMVFCQILNDDEVFDIVYDRHFMSAILGMAAIMILAMYAVHLGLINAILRTVLKPGCITLSYLWRASFLSFLLSGLFSIDATCTAFVSNVLKQWKEHDRSSVELETLLLALSTSANLGSVLSIWGSVHMALLATKSAALSPSVLHLRHCCMYLAPAALLGWTVNMACLMLHFLIRKRGVNRLRTTSPSSRGGDTPGSSRMTDLSLCIAYTATGNEKKLMSNGYFNSAAISPTDARLLNENSHVLLLGDLEDGESDVASATMPHVLETINEDEELQITNPTPLRPRRREVKVAPAAVGELLDDDLEAEEEEEEENESDLGKGLKKLGALDMDSMDIVYKPGLLSRTVIGREATAGEDDEDIHASHNSCSNDINDNNANRQTARKSEPVAHLNRLDAAGYKPGALSNVRSPSRSGKSHKATSEANGSAHSRYRHSERSVDSSREALAGNLMLCKPAPLGLPVRSSSSCVLYWSPTNVSMAEFLFERDIAVTASTPGKRCLCFSMAYFTCYVVIVALALVNHITPALNFDIGLASVAVVVVLLLADASVNQRDIQRLLTQHVNWSVLILFACLCVWLAGFQKTRVVAWLWSGTVASHDVIAMETAARLAVTTLALTATAYVLGPVVAAVLLLDVVGLDLGVELSLGRSQLQQQQQQLELVLLLAWCCAVAGNLTPSGGIATLLTTHTSVSVLERRPSYCSQLAYTLPTSLVILMLGVVVIHCLVTVT